MRWPGSLQRIDTHHGLRFPEAAVPGLMAMPEGSQSADLGGPVLKCGLNRQPFHGGP